MQFSQKFGGRVNKTFQNKEKNEEVLNRNISQRISAIPGNFNKEKLHANLYYIFELIPHIIVETPYEMCS